MQYLCNKTSDVICMVLSAKVGSIMLTPYEALPVDVERWDATAFNNVRVFPTKLAICEKVPASLAEKRKVYLELQSAQEDTKKVEEIKKLENDIGIFESELKKETEILSGMKQNLKDISEKLEDLKQELKDYEEGSTGSKKCLKAIKNQEDLLLKETQKLNIEQEEYQQALVELQRLKDKLKDIQ